jgi:trk system potassium uptake protein TrkA
MRIVIGGEDEIAVRLAEALMADHQVVLVRRDDPSLAAGRGLDVETVAGSLSSPAALERARVGDAAFFVACSTEDESNLVACMAAKRLGTERTVAFLHRPEYVRSLEAEGGPLAGSFGVDTVVWPAERLAREIVRIVAVPGALDVEVFEGGRVRMRKYPVDANSPFLGRTVREAGVPGGVVLVAVRRGETMTLPRGDTRFEAGDKVLAMGSVRGLQALARGLRGPHGDADVGGIVTIVGGGAVGETLAAGLEEAGGFELKLIESDRRRCEEVASTLRSTLVLHGDGTDLELLESERVDRSRVLVAVTSSDEKNLLVSLLGKQLGILRIVTRADKPANERLFERVGIDVVRSARGSAIHAVVNQVIAGRSELRAEVEHGDARVIEMTIPTGVPPTRLKDLHAPVFAIVGAILRDKKTLIPRGDDVIQGGDRVLLFCDRTSEAAAREFFGSASLPRA